jgi:CDP-diglyceride synthetase|tara:strand:+ start:36390 stop:36779 length:390 start_codon:yes stop_codon:yes gene_type:complete
MGSIITKNTVTFLRLLHVANYIFLILYFASILGIRYFFTTNRRKYFRILSTVYTLGIGIVLISLRFPFLIDLRKKTCMKEVTTLMLSAGLIVLSTLSKEDIAEVWELIPDRRLADIEKYKAQKTKGNVN